MVPQSFIARVNEVARLKGRTKRINWENLLAKELNTALARSELKGEAYTEAQTEAIAYALKTADVSIDPNALLPF